MLRKIGGGEDCVFRVRAIRVMDWVVVLVLVAVVVVVVVEVVVLMEGMF